MRQIDKHIFLSTRFEQNFVCNAFAYATLYKLQQQQQQQQQEFIQHYIYI